MSQAKVHGSTKNYMGKYQKVLGSTKKILGTIVGSTNNILGKGAGKSLAIALA